MVEAHLRWGPSGRRLREGREFLRQRVLRQSRPPHLNTCFAGTALALDARLFLCTHDCQPCMRRAEHQHTFVVSIRVLPISQQVLMMHRKRPYSAGLQRRLPGPGISLWQLQGGGGGSSSVNVGEHFLEWVIHHSPHLKCTADKNHIPITYDPPPPPSGTPWANEKVW